MKKKQRGLKRLKIAVICGGLSAEREVSLATGTAIYKELKKHGHNVVRIDIKRRSIAPILNAKPDVVINGLHGTYGEDGVIQGMLDFHGIPYAGCGVAASALAMDKVKTKKIAGYHGVSMPAWCLVEEKTGLNKTGIKYPVILKPVSEGSSVGVYIAKNKKEAEKAFDKIKRIYGCVLVEKYIKGTEIAVPVLKGCALPVIEIEPVNEFYDYESKYTKGMSNHYIPARLPAQVLKAAQRAAVSIDKIMGCRDYSRVDFIVKNRKPYFIEINTLPGMTGMSLFPESAAKAGISFYRLLSILIKSAAGRKK